MSSEHNSKELRLSDVGIEPMVPWCRPRFWCTKVVGGGLVAKLAAGEAKAGGDQSGPALTQSEFPEAD